GHDDGHRPVSAGAPLPAPGDAGPSGGARSSRDLSFGVDSERPRESSVRPGDGSNVRADHGAPCCSVFGPLAASGSVPAGAVLTELPPAGSVGSGSAAKEASALSAPLSGPSGTSRDTWTLTHCPLSVTPTSALGPASSSAIALISSGLLPRAAARAPARAASAHRTWATPAEAATSITTMASTTPGSRTASSAVTEPRWLPRHAAGLLGACTTRVSGAYASEVLLAAQPPGDRCVRAAGAPCAPAARVRGA